MALLLAAGLAALWLPVGPALRPAAGQEGEETAKKKERVEEEDEVKPKKKPRDEEEDEVKPRKKPRDEEEEEAKPKRKVTHVDEPREKEPKARPAPTAVDLRVAARDAKQDEVRNLFTALASPYDLVTVRGLEGVKVSGTTKRGGVWRVSPQPARSPSELKGKITLKVIDKLGSQVRREKVGASDVSVIRPYEVIAEDAINEFLAVNFEPKYLPRSEQLRAAEQALSFVLRFHEGARERGVRKGDGWAGISASLRGQLLKVLLEDLGLLVKAEQWPPAFDLAGRLVETYTHDGERDQIGSAVRDLTKGALAEVGDIAGRDGPLHKSKVEELGQRIGRLRLLVAEFAGRPAVRPIEDGLREQARALVERAKKLVVEKGKKDVHREAREQRLELARLSWPQVPGGSLAGGPDGALRVGVRHLPKYLSPALAWTESDLRAVELLFEPLVKSSPGTRGAWGPRPGLAAGRPRVVPLGREFRLLGGARWSDGKPVTVGDVRFTLRQIQANNQSAMPVALGEILSEVVAGGDSSRVSVTLRRGYLDPLSLLSFKIVPEHINEERPASGEPFAFNPTGSGPFAYEKGPFADGALKGKQYARFVANNHYGSRTGKTNLPAIAEVRLIGLGNAEGGWDVDPVAALEAKQIDLALDLSAEQIAKLKGKAGIQVVLPRSEVPNRRIYFLAVNHDRSGLRNADLRVALARAINREKLLDDHFRKGLAPAPHKALNGPYPAGSWACNPAIKDRDDKGTPQEREKRREESAKSKWKRALSEFRKAEVKLDVLYPEGEPAVKSAIEDLCKQAGELLPGLKLVPRPKAPWDLRKHVELRDYELAYFHHDFLDETFWLEPLLGQAGPAHRGRNFLDYEGPLRGRAAQAAALRDFSQVRQYVHAIHRDFWDSEMPFIPLWQLDPLAAHRTGLRAGTFDPLRVFTDVEQWRLDP
jgi:ABC-type transport system substrate-binding protein